MPDTTDSAPQTIEGFADAALRHGIEQLKAAGTPLHPFLIDQAGGMYLLVDNVGGNDPMELALAAIKSHIPNVEMCALVIDTRVTLSDGKKWDALLAMTCARDKEEGVILAQRYVPKGFFRKLRLEGEFEVLGKAKNFIAAALSET